MITPFAQAGRSVVAYATGGESWVSRSVKASARAVASLSSATRVSASSWIASTCARAVTEAESDTGSARVSSASSSSRSARHDSCPFPLRQGSPRSACLPTSAAG